MHRQSARLVDDQQVLVLIDDLDGEIRLLQVVCHRRRRGVQLDGAARLEHERCALSAPINSNATGRGQRRQLRAAELGQGPRQELVEPLRPVGVEDHGLL